VIVLTSDSCHICGDSNRVILEEHHIVPRRIGGRDTTKNVVTLCSNCHKAVESIYDTQAFERIYQRMLVEKKYLEEEEKKTVYNVIENLQMIRDEKSVDEDVVIKGCKVKGISDASLVRAALSELVSEQKIWVNQGGYGVNR